MDKKDSRLTAYVLGELSDDERAEVDAVLAGSADLRAEVEALRRTADLLGRTLTESPCPQLHPEQREQIHDRAQQAEKVLPSDEVARRRNRRRWLAALAMAATVLIAVLITTNYISRRQVTRVGDEPLDVLASSSEETQLNIEMPEPTAPPPGVLGDLEFEHAPETSPTEEWIGDLADQTSEPAGDMFADPGETSLMPELAEIEAEPSESHIGDRRPATRQSLIRAYGGSPPAGSPAPGDEPRPRSSMSGGDIASGSEGLDGQPSTSNAIDFFNAAEDIGRTVGEFSGTGLEGRGRRDDDRLARNESQVSPAQAAFDTSPAATTEKPDTDGESAETGQPLRESTRAGEKSGQAPPQRTWRRAQAIPNASRVMVGDRDELPQEGMQVSVTIDGFRARVLLDLYYFNPHDRQLEGSFKLRLPDEASLYYFAFGPTTFEYRPAVDSLATRGFLTPELVRSSGTGPQEILRARSESWRDVKQARVVPREKAAFAYSETVRRRVDPALVEWSGAGVFQARVFPLAPRQLHRIVVGYDVNLRQDGPDLVYSLQLPEDVSQCMVDVDVSALPGLSAEITPAVRPFVSGGRAFYHFQDPADKTIDVRLLDPGSILLTGQDESGGAYFATRVRPDLPADAGRSGSTHAIFLVDTSLSSHPDKFSVWLDLLEAILDRNRDQLRQFAVLFYNVESHWWKTRYVENTPDNVRQLMTDASMLALEGATDLQQALAEATSPIWLKAADKAPDVDLFLLSDGAATWGETDVNRMARTLQVGNAGALFAYKTGLTGTAIETLENLARDTGGAVFSVATEQEVGAAATAHRQRPWRLLNALVAGADDLLLGGRPRFVYPGQTLLIVGRGPAQAELRLHVRRGDDDRTLTIPFDRIVESDLAARTYGQVAVGQLEDLGSDIEEISVAYARHFRVPGRTCSLLMLESEADYERFNIKPEDDRFVVGSRPADDLIRQKLDELAQTLGDARQAVKSWLARLERHPGLQFHAPTALELMVDGLPAEAFEVEVPQLVCELRRRDELPKKYFQQLDVGRLDYDLVLEEAQRRRDQVGATDGLKCLSSLVEASPGEVGATLDVAFSAIDWGLPGQAYPLLRRVADARPYVPSLYLAMADCLAELDRADLAMICYEIALNTAWQDRYRDVAQIATVQYLQLLERIVAGELKSFADRYARARLESLAQSTSVRSHDLIVTMLWNTDRTDVDLHVQEPSGEICFYQNRDTRSGGHLTEDVTEGFGPEMYTLPHGVKGSYRILADYYSTDANRTGNRTKVFLTVYELPGQERQRVTRHAVLLQNQKEKQLIAELQLR